jgi:hypothetical protein
MINEDFTVSKFGLVGQQYTMAFSFIMGTLKAEFERDKKVFTKEELIKIISDSVDFAKE